MMELTPLAGDGSMIRRMVKAAGVEPAIARSWGIRNVIYRYNSHFQT